MSGKSATVDKPIPVAYDLGNLAVFDSNPLESNKLSDASQVNEYLEQVTRDNTQLLINQILSQPVRNTTDSVSEGQEASIALITLPDPSTPLPREKSVPKPREMTRWEKFAAKKGIQAKGKTGKMIYDEESGEWVPKWGYKGNNKQLDNQWLVEMNEKTEEKDKDTLIDPRTLARAERKKLVKKYELQQKKNLKAQGKGK
ncbi:Ribosomal protein L11 binding protein [Komagataella phaffii CBS 7435]|uniref:Ribosome biogenesis regulatory protein n=2 Tax=Komagataella phaffii TaxID=460519 RepID=C4QW25_KOMPG|nr:Essential protein that binds ribosomal protein L11 [Komagataella phaffii GS115]AOA60676.1 GQ67_02657T0 [Komagataella phaffii]CAH2446114.1 Ribosomal protein L11 binding protein [Komagataella phaffii CBS 7435]AOA66596.1 GQ68_02591T0 [Komagataella phaffii GS115]CAY67448.1 Essential protein that binds ribosomal protein L11 [Komagataella phaffii GS115]CCA36547.1 Ribosomal protein L11 binding protein [Komagataella phaffii CBS 7435]